MTFANFSSVAWEAATVAGTLIREHWQKPKNIDYKVPSTWSLQWIGNVSGALLKCYEAIFQTIPF